MTRSRPAALLGLLSVAGALLLALAGPAAAHVTVHSTDAVQGGEAELTFRVPTESATASTTKLQVQLPTATPFATVLVRPMTGWTWNTTTVHLAKPVTDDDGDQVSDVVSRVDWTADSAADAIAPGEYQDFDLSVGPLPRTRTIAFAALQTYSDGTVVAWNETAAPGSSVVPDHPKPVLTLAPAAGGSTTTVTRVTASSSSEVGPVVLSVIALIVAAGALGLAVVGRARRAA
jgi:periplasmic copper chaperone A